MDWNKANSIVATRGEPIVSFDQGVGVGAPMRPFQPAFPTQLPHGGATTPTPSLRQGIYTYRVDFCSTFEAMGKKTSPATLNTVCLMGSTFSATDANARKKFEALPVPVPVSGEQGTWHVFFALMRQQGNQWVLVTKKP